MPKESGLVEEIRHRLHTVVVVLLVPLFFAFTGLRTSIALISGTAMLFYCGLILIVAVAGKFGGSMLAARVMGTNWRDSAAIGILMNTRGLIELVILNIGLDIGVLTRPLFSMMVVMAVVTTLITTPLLSWFYTGPQGLVALDEDDQVSPPAIQQRSATR
jgi:Kef-type K+ transport system membrane component KefB